MLGGGGGPKECAVPQSFCTFSLSTRLYIVNVSVRVRVKGLGEDLMVQEMGFIYNTNKQKQLWK